MNQRTEERKSINLPVKMHFFGEQVDVSTSEDVSEGGFFVRTQSVRQLDKGVVALVTILINDNQEHHYLAEVVRITDSGAAFQVIHSVDQ